MTTRTNDPVLHARAALARSYRSTSVTPAQRDEMRRALTAAKVERAIREAVQAAPPLTGEQRSRLARLLSGGVSK